MIAEGLSPKEIGGRLGVSWRSVESHRAHLMSKLGGRTLTDLARFVIRERLVEPRLRRLRQVISKKLYLLMVIFINALAIKPIHF